MDDEKQKIIGLIIKLNAIDLSMYDDVFFKQAIQKRIQANNSLNFSGYYELFEKNEEERFIFLNSLQVNYTEFFRNELTFSVLNKIILPKIISNINGNNYNEIRIWCAACANGQEAYSLAMLFEEYLKNKHFNYRIFATDQSETFINTAKNGVYHLSQIGNLTTNQLNKWFDKKEEYYVVKNKLKTKIEFSVFDLFNKYNSCPPESIYGNFDIVICANLLYYYKPEFRHLILKKTTDSITKNGYLITSETERETLIDFKFKEVFPYSAIFQKK
ncbi:MAG: CheR family methyltransferase [Bacteroidia bacterium]